MHAVAKVNGTTIAETDKYEVVEGNIYVRALHIASDTSMQLPLSHPLTLDPVPSR
ncbi:hypothetical protein LTR16_008928, partial [Cryomyces antarcticus]